MGVELTDNHAPDIPPLTTKMKNSLEPMKNRQLNIYR